MGLEQPHLLVLAGQNGAGKSTAAPTLLAEALQITEFVNADTIAQGLSAFRPEGVALEAGRVMLGRLKELASQRVHFAFETTLASRSFAPGIKKLRLTGYAFFLAFLWLPSPEMALARVQDRTRRGGHDVPSETIRRRYWSGLSNFFNLYRPLADSWDFYDNSAPHRPQLIASGKAQAEDVIIDLDTWAKIKKGLSNVPTQDKTD